MTDQLKERVYELLADRATGDLTEKKAIELETLLEKRPELDDLTMELAAAATALTLSGPSERLPGDLRERLVHDAGRFFQYRQEPEVVAFERAAPRTGSWVSWAGWLAAAAVLIFALLISQPDQDPDPQKLRAILLAEISNTTKLPFQATKDEAAVKATGDVVWNTARQKGVMRIRGLLANDPSRFQYQLWIFDKDRDERYPVDGGVFDIPEGQDEVLIPIDARVPVSGPAIFAITVEPPGGVVVSNRERIVLFAQPAG